MPGLVRREASARWATWLRHSVRTGVGAAISLGVARLLAMPEAYWAAVTTLIVMQSTLGAAWTVSRQRFVGTALGATFGGVLATWIEPRLAAGALFFGLAVAVLGPVCAALRLDRSAYRFAGITLAIVTFAGRDGRPFVLALHRFIEVSVGITVGLALTALWPTDELARVDAGRS